VIRSNESWIRNGGNVLFSNKKWVKAQGGRMYLKKPRSLTAEVETEEAPEKMVPTGNTPVSTF